MSLNRLPSLNVSDVSPLVVKTKSKLFSIIKTLTSNVDLSLYAS